MKRPISSLICSLALTVLATAYAPPASAVEVSYEKDASLPLVFINVAVKDGSVDDPAGKSGLTNFLGEMMLRGTKLRSKEQIDLDLDQIGASLDAETRDEALIFRGAVLSSQVGPFLSILQEILTQPKFSEREIAKLKGEVTSGIMEEIGNDGDLGARDATQFMFMNHPYGKPVNGKVKDIESITRKDIEAQYGQMIRDRRLVIVGSGDPAANDPIRKFADQLSDLRPGGTPAEMVSRPEDSPRRRLLIVDKPDRTQTQIYGGQVGIQLTDPDFFPLYLANHVFGGGSFLARLMVEIRVKRGWSYGAYTSFRFGRQPRSWSFHLFPTAKDAAPALAMTLAMIEKLRADGITPAELEFARSSLVNSAGFMYNTPAKRVENKLLERTLDLPDGFMQTYATELNKVTLDQSNQALKKFLRPDRLAITVVATAKDLKPALAKAAGVPEEQVEVWPYTRQ